jgi:hypothetical protein
MLPDTNNSDMEDVCTEGTELTHIQDLSTSEQTPHVRNETFLPINIQRNNEKLEFWHQWNILWETSFI